MEGIASKLEETVRSDQIIKKKTFEFSLNPSNDGMIASH